ncbi:hypothetical protein BDZ45DRAFT_752632 [Acephala macrosclerotiorum]|nr:hypothetical protein BDZ45DRAFT_752632 [Acephala macrosclerotiorum]
MAWIPSKTILNFRAGININTLCDEPRCATLCFSIAGITFFLENYIQISASYFFPLYVKGTGSSPNDGDAIFKYVKANTIPNWHASGINVMRPFEDGGVVDPRLRAYRVNRLRVVNNSIILALPGVHIQGPVFMIGEKGAQMIREDWGF